MLNFLVYTKLTLLSSLKLCLQLFITLKNIEIQPKIRLWWKHLSNRPLLFRSPLPVHPVHGRDADVLRTGQLHLWPLPPWFSAAWSIGLQPQNRQLPHRELSSAAGELQVGFYSRFYQLKMYTEELKSRSNGRNRRKTRSSSFWLWQYCVFSCHLDLAAH